MSNLWYVGKYFVSSERVHSCGMVGVTKSACFLQSDSATSVFIGSDQPHFGGMVGVTESVYYHQTQHLQIQEHCHQFQLECPLHVQVSILQIDQGC